MATFLHDHRNKNMKILMLGWELPPYNSGGLGVACFEMSKALALRGTSIDFVVPYSATHPAIDFMMIHSATDITPSSQAGTKAYDGLLNHHSMDHLQTAYIKKVDTLLQKAPKPYDAIHAHDWLTMKAGMFAKTHSNIPLVVHVHATEFDRAGSKPGNPIIHEIEYQGLMMADRIIAVSNITKRIIVEKYGIPTDKIEVMHNAINADSLGSHEYDYRTYACLETLRSEGWTIVSALSRLTIQKGLTQLLEAVAKASQKLDRIVLLIAGDGEQRDELIEMAANLGIADRVLFTGFVRGKQWRDAYTVADVFVMSSVSEPFGLTALEAAHYDTGVIVTRQSGVSEVLNSVLKYDFWDTDRLADCLVGVAASPALRANLKHDVKKEYANLSWAEVAHRCTAMYKRLLVGATP